MKRQISGFFSKMFGNNENEESDSEHSIYESSDEESKEFDKTDSEDDKDDELEPQELRRGLKRTVSDPEEPLSPRPPVLKRRMSNKEMKIPFVDGYHINQNIAGNVNLQMPGQPDHTFNAVAFDIYCMPGSYIVKVTGFSVAGRLNRMRVFAIEDHSCHTYRTDSRKWTLVYDKKHKTSWNDLVELKFDQPVVITPGNQVGFYVHSNCQDDRGLKYRSCRQGVVYSDDYLALTHGFAHTSSIPFDSQHGWFRECRTLAGSIQYEAIPIRWTNYSHDTFPESFKMAIATIRSLFSIKEGWTDGLVDDFISFLGLDWFGVVEQKCFVDELNQKLGNRNGRHRQSYWDDGFF